MGQNNTHLYPLIEQVEMMPVTLIESKPFQTVAKILNITLADEAVLSMKTRSALWNVHGAGFYDRHILFEAQLKQLTDVSELISRRSWELGRQPLGSFEEFLKNTRLVENPGQVPDMMDLFTTHESMIRYIREDAKKCSEDYCDKGTSDCLVEILYQHEKMAWMLRGHIEPELTGDEH